MINIENHDTQNNATDRGSEKRYEYMPFESDHTEKIGSVFLVRSGLKKISERESLFHHWAIGIRFSDSENWVLLEGKLKNSMLTSSYRHINAKELPENSRILRLNDYISQLRELTAKQYLMSTITVTTTLKALSTKTLHTVKASPMQLRGIAASFEDVPYVPGTNDCQTWFVRALSKLECYEVGDKSLGAMSVDTMTGTVGVVSKPLIEVAGGGTSAVCELVGTGKKLATKDGNAVLVVADGSANTVNHLVKGVTRGAGSCFDAAGGTVANVLGLVTLGGYASKNRDAQSDSTMAANPVHAGVQRVGRAGGNLAYGVTGAAKYTVEGVGQVTTTVVSGATKVVGNSIVHVGKGVATGLKSLGIGKRRQ